LNKQEDGGVLKPRRKYLLLSPDLQPSRWRRNLLAQRNYFADSQGIWQRKGNSRRLRYWFKKEFQYKERFHYQETAREVVQREAQRVFRQELKR
jgi:hypothetical protein